MTPAADPLKTRSLPGHLWEKFPEHWQLLDKELQDKLENAVPRNSTPWKQIEWLTEDSYGIALLGLLLLLLFLWSHKKQVRNFWNNRQKKSSILFVVLISCGLGLSDLISMRLKILFGRLKPHVDFYHPDFLPALSLPSSHAFNSSFLLAMILGFNKSEQSARQKFFYFIVFIFILFVGCSRVLFGQHYPLDVFTGWLLGSILGNLYSKILNKLIN